MGCSLCVDGRRSALNALSDFRGGWWWWFEKGERGKKTPYGFHQAWQAKEKGLNWDMLLLQPQEKEKETDSGGRRRCALHRFNRQSAMNLHDWCVSVASPLGCLFCALLWRWEVKRPLLPPHPFTCVEKHMGSQVTAAVRLCVCVREVRVEQSGWVGACCRCSFFLV